MPTAALRSNRMKIWPLWALMLTQALLAAEPTLDADILLRGFEHPPTAAKPRVWWPWMDGNVTKEGIRKDLEWMQRIGIGGINCIQVAWNTPRVVKRPLNFMTPDWKS